MKLRIKFLISLLVICCFCALVGLVACSDDEESDLGYSIIFTPNESSCVASLPDSIDSQSDSVESEENESQSASANSATDAESAQSSINSEQSESHSSCDSFENSVEESMIIEPHEHVWIITHDILPDCTKMGKDTHSCLTCRVSFSVDVAALGHVIVTKEGKEPTCKEDGWTESSRCTRCNTVFLKEEALPKLITHTIVNNACTICDYTEITYELHDSGYFICTGSIFDNPRELVIADTYMGLQVREIRAETFYQCYSLTKITLGKNITEIGEKAFFECYNLFEIYNKSDIELSCGSTDMGYVAKYAKDVYTEGNESKISTDENGVITYTDGSDVVFLGYGGNEIEITLPEGITDINKCSFSRSTLVEVTLSSTVKRIDAQAFYDSKTIEKVNLNEELEYISIAAFLDMEALRSVVFAKTEGWKAVNVIGQERDPNFASIITDPYAAATYLMQNDEYYYSRESEN